jgi:predicted metalloprotease with PDZ domain
LGCTFTKSGQGAKIRSVFDGGVAQTTGLSAGDVVLAVDGIKVTSDSIAQLLSRYAVGEKVSVHFFRRDELHERTMELQPAPFKAYYMEMDDSNIDVTERRRLWMYGK